MYKSQERGKIKNKVAHNTEYNERIYWVRRSVRKENRSDIFYIQIFIEHIVFYKYVFSKQYTFFFATSFIEKSNGETEIFRNKIHLLIKTFPSILNQHHSSVNLERQIFSYA